MTDMYSPRVMRTAAFLGITPLQAYRHERDKAILRKRLNPRRNRR